MITVNIKKSNKCNGDVSLFLSFPYDNKVVELVRSFPTRYWDKDNKEWEVPLKQLETLITELSDYEIELCGDLSVLRDEKPKIDFDYTFKTNPFEHQIDGLKFGLEHDKWLLGDEQGLGKTKQVIDIAVAKKQMFGYKHCLIVCGVNGLKWNWQNEIKIHSNETGHILGQRIKNGKITIGSTKDKIADLDALESISDYFIITNVESLRDDTLVAKLSHLCDIKAIQLIAADEVHKMKNPSSQQGKGFLKLNADCKIAMTGTPLMNTPLDLYIILKWLGYEKHAFYSFKNHYCIMGGFGGYQIVGYKNLAELQDRIDDIMLRRLKSDVLDLPEKLFVDEYVDMTPKQSQIYKEIAMEIKANIDKVKMSSTPLAELIRMRQATGYTGILSSTVLESAKLDRMEEIVEESIANGKKVVIFSNWTQITNAVCDRLYGKYSTLAITGETKDEDRQTKVNLFQNDPKFNIMVGTIGAMGTGLTLTAGTTMIFLDHPWNRALYDQAVDRCHRIGQKTNITVYNILCKNTIDERIWELVNKKGAMSDALIDGKFNGNPSDLIDYLLA